MLKNFFWMNTFKVAIALFVSLPFPIATSAQNFDRIYVFGDSLSDVGNVYKATNKRSPTSPPYFQGRYSDGPVWVEYLASKLNLTVNTGNNFAYGGATTGNSQDLPLGVLAQIEEFKANPSSGDRNSLYIIWAGANDYLGGATDTRIPVNNLVNAVKSIAAVGAKNIVVVNLPDLGKLPGTRIAPRANLLNSLTAKHNAELAASIDTLRQQLNSDIDIKYLDVNSIFNQVIKSPNQFGFSNVTQPCFSQGIICDNPKDYLFWDNIHPSAAAHKLLVELAFPQLQPPLKSNSFSLLQFTMPALLFIFTFLGIGLIIKRQKNLKNRR